MQAVGIPFYASRKVVKAQPGPGQYPFWHRAPSAESFALASTRRWHKTFHHMSQSSAPPPAPSGGDVILYQTEDGRTRLQVRLHGETVWLSLNQLADLFQRDKSVISKHIRNIFAEGELRPQSTVAKFATVQNEGERTVERDIEFYNLDVIISVGYRVKSHRGTQFRIWATQRLREYIVKGFTMDDERLKNPPQQFFATVQNKMHWAVHGQTAAEVIHARVDATKPFMGLKTTRPGGIIRKEDVSVAKNYLDPGELGVLNRIVTVYLEFAELQALRRKVMTMREWIAKLDEFLKLSDHELLDHAGKISAEQARAKAESEYDRYRKLLDAQPRPVDADFEKAVAKLNQSPPAKKDTHRRP